MRSSLSIIIVLDSFPLPAFTEKKEKTPHKGRQRGDSMREKMSAKYDQNESIDDGDFIEK